MHYHTPKQKKILELKIHLKYYLNVTNSYNPVRVAKDYKYEKKCSLVHKSGGDGGEEC